MRLCNDRSNTADATKISPHKRFLLNKGFPLNGADTFMLGLDYDMRRNGSAGNLCHLVVTLAPDSDLRTLCTNLAETPLLQYGARLRLRTPLLRAPRWQTTTASITSFEIAAHVSSENDLHAWINQHRVNIRRQPPIGIIVLPQYDQGPSLLIFWHHSLSDAHGGELLLQNLSSSEISTLPIPASPSKPALRACISQAQNATRIVFDKAAGRIARLVRNSSTPPRYAYTKIRFSHAETAYVDQLSLKLTAGIFSSALYLAISARAFAQLTQTTAPIFIPVPHDMRRHTRERSPLSNQVSVVFFRLRPGDLSSLEVATNSVIEQLHEAITTRAPAKHLAFLQLVRRLPIPLLWKVIEMPAKGHPASLYVSDIGSSLSNITHIRDQKVVSASHYPPNPTPPGLTMVWSRYRDQLELTVCYDETLIPRTTIDHCMNCIKSEITTSNAS
jgi:hypothetical protein